MSLIDFNQSYLPILNFILSLIGLTSLIILIKQYNEENRWKKLQSSYNFIGIGQELKLQERIYEVYGKLDMYPFPEVCKPLTKEQVAIICKNREATLITNMFLNHFQNLCTAFYFGLVDENVFNGIHANRICWWYTILKPYIDRRKKDYNNPNIWSEFEKIALDCFHT